MARPSFNSAWSAFMAVRLPVADVGKKIGGNVGKNTDPAMGNNGFKNACPIRMSYVLNKTGFPIRKDPHYAMVSGADKQQYIYHIDDMMDYLTKTLGKPDKTFRSPKTSDFARMRGIIVIKGHGWSNAKGHVTLWNGKMCSDTCHLMNDPDNGLFIPETASIWVLK